MGEIYMYLIMMSGLAYLKPKLIMIRYARNRDGDRRRELGVVRGEEGWSSKKRV